MVKDIILGTAGGLALFLYGMTLMSEGLKNVAGQKLKSILESMTKKRIVGCFVGLAATAIIQSSSASTVMIIGFINAGLLTLAQAIPVIIGTNIGTTATAWLVSMSGLEAFDITSYSLPSVAVGFIMQIAGKTRKVRGLGEILLGFGLLFIGIGFMKDSFAGLENSPAVQQIFIRSADTPILALLAGLAITLLVQSSSASVASIQVLAASGVFGADYSVAISICIPFILGANIGTTITAQLAAIRTNVNARRAAWAHTLFNVFGAFICYWFVGLIGKWTIIVSPWQLSATTVAMSIAIAHTAIKTFEAVVFLPLSDVLAKVATFLVKDKGPADEKPVILERRLLDTPVLALSQARLEIIRMAQIAKKAIVRSVKGLILDDKDRIQSVAAIEDTIDEFQHEITTYLIELSRKQLSDEVSIELPVLLHTVNDLERVGDHAVNIVELAERKIEQKINFSECAVKEAEELFTQINEMIDLVILALENSDKDAARSALENEKNLNKMQLDFRRSHVKRMTENICSPENSLIFIDLVNNIEKMGDHLTNIAQAVIGGLQWDGVEEAKSLPKN
ncbi:MAG TPA: Na/Pi cotransporter family protein [Sedimentisphaerales bacterium]|nr:Na/Pi cotransporter family protein [Sedimentisphaerales bacterium]